MEKDYYKILGINKNADDSNIKIAYRKLALENHPHFSKSTDIRTFNQIAEAYEVLSDSKYRKNYDKYGEFGLKEGIANPNGGFFGGYRFIGNSFEIFEKFFGSSNPFFSDFTTNPLSVPTEDNSNETQENNYANPTDLIIDVPCSFEELYNGCQKSLIFTRSVVSEDGVSSIEEQCTKTIDILRGSCQNTTISFEKEGNFYPNSIKTNLVFKVIEIPHDSFVREGDDLICVKCITLIDAIAALPIEIVKFTQNTLDSRVLTISFDEIISPRTKKIISNEGMPVYKSEARGKLIVKFQIKFPKYIPQDKKDILIDILS